MSVPVNLLKDRVRACPGYLPRLWGLSTGAKGGCPGWPLRTEHHSALCPLSPVGMVVSP